ncbi:uncharacterized protein N7503_000848 [Penicillium pulvis]|uniref:uncharacterized protein n=1 Tax=Penicillium pulvis TaxID=1562058 RepID=UPI0025485AD6|nr:uncharacterized protein N7503_000848 [Penicillium pulvis]KAJ5814098.1 hypothetical protein N7503_000848 [Penicillium pulvis]
MANLQGYNQHTEPDDHLIGMLVCRLSVISSLVGSGKSRNEAEVYFENAFQTINWNGMMTSLEVAEGPPRATIEEANDARDQVVTLIGQTYRACPESRRLALLRGLADIFSSAASGQARRENEEILITETPQSSASSPAHSEPSQDNDHSVAIHRYTCLLHERAQRENKRLQKIEEAITIDPPLCSE